MAQPLLNIGAGGAFQGPNSVNWLVDVDLGRSMVGESNLNVGGGKAGGGDDDSDGSEDRE